mmetsp:Transcript_22781/g.67000  ORF Transcript_22781/g.67000 Transcript_22781/m.67000 type:complete len:201 (-) Transcript_22781:1207-1809(-)
MPGGGAHRRRWKNEYREHGTHAQKQSALLRTCACIVNVERASEEAQLVLVERDEHVLGLAVVAQHHLVRLEAEARLLVAAERGVRRVGVVAVDPDAARLDGARHRVHLVGVAGPHARAEAVDGVVGDGDRLVLGFEGDHPRDRPEDLLLEDLHAVGPREDGRLDVVAARDAIVLGAAGQHLGPLLLADGEVVEDPVLLCD